MNDFEQRMQAEVDQLRREGRLPTMEQFLAAMEEGAKAYQAGLRKTGEVTSIADHPEAWDEVQPPMPLALRPAWARLLNQPLRSARVVPIKK